MSEVNFKVIKSIDENIKFIPILLLLNDNRIAACTKDKMIKIYDINNEYQCDMTIKGHIYCVIPFVR